PAPPDSAGKPTEEPRQQLEQRRQECWTEAARLQQEGKWPEAIAAMRQALDTERGLFGDASPEVAYTLSSIARGQEERKAFSDAESIWRQVLELIEKLHGPDDWRTGDARRALEACRRLAGFSPEQRSRLETAARQMLEAEALFNQGKPRDAIGPARQSVEIQKEILGPKSLSYANGLSNLANFLLAAGRYAEAEPLLREAIQINRDVLGCKHPAYMAALNNLAGMYQLTGDCARAEPLLKEAVQVVAECYGQRHPDYATALNNLGGLYYTEGEHRQAEPLFLQALELRKELIGTKHPDYATSLNNLAGLYESTRDFAKAEPLYRKAMELRREVLGTDHPDYAASLNNLAGLYRATGRLKEAEPLYRQAVEIDRRVLGEKHPGYARSLNNLAALYRLMGEYAKAEPLYHQALEAIGTILDDTFAVLSERQQLAMTRSFRQTLDGSLSVAIERGSGPQWYPYVLAWKGSVFARQRQTRLAAARPELAPLLAELQETTGKLATLAFGIPAPEEQQSWRERVEELSRQKEDLEADLSRRSADFRKSRQRASPEELQAALPDDAVLVDFLEYDRAGPQQRDLPHSKEPVETQRRLIAFVLRAGSPVAAVDLGPVAPIREAIDRWRAGLGDSKAGKEAGQQLRDWVWKPLEAHLGKPRIVLVSPDGALARFPPAALPGEAADSYLIETCAIAVVPVPQLLPEMLSASPAKPAGDASLLLVGDVDYDAPLEAASGKDRSGLTRSETIQFHNLENTRGEILAVRDSFELAHENGDVRVLRGRQAGEEAVRRETSRRRFLHLATHGFFAPLEPDADASRNTGSSKEPYALASREFAAFHPGLLSALALAGANRPPQPGVDDGLLTAEEVASLDLKDVELAVLSACETGLGSLAAGEGVLGLQRAFQVAGARTVVASLWKVNDEATRVLMERFYENLWSKKLGKLEALRQAQLWMLREGPDRGLRPIPRKPESANESSKKLPPLVWAAFVLSGDWR
ncbi:MAG: CHAT domain-containing protein, partial [Pirellulales bacterium]|nr:CHAT domain-containing protein [Pirellulales bacterium]